jgi:hypothetical protein
VLFSFKSGMGTKVLVESSLWVWNECSERPTENLATGNPSGVKFSEFGHAGLTPQEYFSLSSFRSGMGTNFSVESSSWAWNEHSERCTENLTTSDSSSVKFSVFGQFWLHKSLWLCPRSKVEWVRIAWLKRVQTDRQLIFIKGDTASLGYSHWPVANNSTADNRSMREAQSLTESHVPGRSHTTLKFNRYMPNLTLNVSTFHLT